MFTFGLFATHVPYMVLVALYACYLGCWLFSSLFSQLPVDNDSSLQQVVAVERSSSIFTGNEISKNDSHYFFAKYFSDLTTAMNLRLFKRRIAFICLPVLPCPAKVYVWQLYNRPPPTFYCTA